METAVQLPPSASVFREYYPPKCFLVLLPLDPRRKLLAGSSSSLLALLTEQRWCLGNS